MSGLATLPPDQRAVLQLILKQGRGYGDLARLLRIDESAVRARALAGLETLALPSEALVPERRQAIADYLLGQADDEARIAAMARLATSDADRRWAAALHDELAPVARDPLPDVPEAATFGDPEPPVIDYEPLPTDEPVAADEPLAPADEATRAEEHPVPAEEPAPAAEPVRAQAPRWTAPPAPAPRRGSRIGGAVLLAGVAILVAVVVIVLVTRGGKDDKNDAAQSAQVSTDTTTTDTTATTGTGTTAPPRYYGQANLRGTNGGRENGAAIIVQTPNQPRRRTLALQVDNMPRNGPDDAYAIWLRSPRGAVLNLGYNPTPVTRDGGTLAVTANRLPANYRDFNQVVISRESSTAQVRRPTDVVVSGTLRFR